MKKLLILSVFTLVLAQATFSQIEKPVTWNFDVKSLSEENTYELSFHTVIEDGWYIYGLNIPDGGPYPTSVNFDKNSGVELDGKTVSSKKAKVKYDELFQMELELLNGTVTFRQKIKATANDSVKGYVEFQACNDRSCLPPDEFTFAFLPGAVKEKVIEKSAQKKVEKSEAVKTKAVSKVSFNASKLITTASIEKEDTVTTSEEKKEGKVAAEDTVVSPEPDDEPIGDKGLWGLLFMGLGLGILAALTPCVYPIIPLTISVFMKEGQKNSVTIFNGLAFGLSIILIYTSIGFIAGAFKIDLVNIIASHWLPNLIIFLIFIVFAISFFGVFEITLPSSWANKIDQKADKGGIIAPFFMALATVVVSFSCTGLFAGSVLAAGLKGDILTPVIGMLGFSISFALPFTLLAIFPGVMNNLPKSGGWLNSVKVFFAFILLAFSLIFLGNIGLSFIGRDIILSLSIAIFALLGFYLLGKIRFAHDSPVEKISVFRIILVTLMFSISIYLLPGLWGKPLGPVEPFLPVSKSQSFGATNSVVSIQTKGMICDENPRYADTKMHLPHNLKGYFDYEEALACAKEQGKPLFMDFVGHSCKNCKKMYADVWSDMRVLKLLSENYVIAALYTDERTKLPEDEWYTSQQTGKLINTVGKKNVDLQIEKFSSNAQPLYSIVDGDGNVLTKQKTYAYDLDVEKFVRYLEEGLK